MMVVEAVFDLGGASGEGSIDIVMLEKEGHGSGEARCLP